MRVFDQFRGFGRDAKLLITASLLEAVGNALVYFLFVLYLGHLGHSKPDIGIVLLVMGLATTLPLMPAGYLGDRIGRRKTLFMGILFHVLGLAALFAGRDLTDFYFGSALWGLGQALYKPSFISFLSEKIGEKRRKYLFSLQMFFTMMVSSVVVLMAGFLPQLLMETLGTTLASGYRYAFLIALVAVSVQVVPLMLTSEKPVETKASVRTSSDPDREEVSSSERDSDDGSPGEGSPGGGSLDEKDTNQTNQSKTAREPIPWGVLAKLCVPMALLGIGAGLVVPFFQLYFVWRFDTPLQSIGMLFSLTYFLWGLGYLVMPGLAKRFGSVKSIVMVQCFAILALIAIPISQSFWMVAVMYTIRMALMNSTWPILQSYSMGQVPKDHRSFTVSATSFSFDGPKAISPGAAGYMYDQNLDSPFFYCAVFYSLATLAFFKFFGRRDDVASPPRNEKSAPPQDDVPKSG